LSPGIKSGLADVLGRTEGGDGLTGRPPAVDGIAPVGFRLGVAVRRAGHGCGLLVREKAPIVPDTARRPDTGRLRSRSVARVDHIFRRSERRAEVAQVDFLELCRCGRDGWNRSAHARLPDWTDRSGASVARIGRVESTRTG